MNINSTFRCDRLKGKHKKYKSSDKEVIVMWPSSGLPKSELSDIAHQGQRVLPLNKGFPVERPGAPIKRRPDGRYQYSSWTSPSQT